MEPPIPEGAEHPSETNVVHSQRRILPPGEDTGVRTDKPAHRAPVQLCTPASAVGEAQHGHDPGEGESGRPPHADHVSGHLEEAMDEHGTAILAMTEEELRMFGILD